jgi:hypothetical protein
MPAQPRLTLPSSQRRIEANRRNARKSTGPKTIAGKSAVRGNALKHGLTADMLVDGEDAEAFRCMANAHMTVFQPQNEVEVELAGTFTLSAWRRRRCVSTEAAMTNQFIRDTARAEKNDQAQHALTLGARLFHDSQNHWQLYPDRLVRIGIVCTRKDKTPGGPDSPARLLKELESTHAGCRWLLDRWHELDERLRENARWEAIDMFKAIRLLGKQPLDVLEDAPGDLVDIFLAGHMLNSGDKELFYELRCEVEDEEIVAVRLRLEELHDTLRRPKNEECARATLEGLIQRQIRRLERLFQQHEADASAEAAERTRRLAFDPGPEADKVRKYEDIAVRRMWRACEELGKWRRFAATEFEEPNAKFEITGAKFENPDYEDIGTEEAEDALPESPECTADVGQAFEPETVGTSGDVRLDAEPRPFPRAPGETRAQRVGQAFEPAIVVGQAFEADTAVGDARPGSNYPADVERTGTNEHTDGRLESPTYDCGGRGQETRAQLVGQGFEPDTGVADYASGRPRRLADDGQLRASFDAALADVHGGNTSPKRERGTDQEPAISSREPSLALRANLDHRENRATPTPTSEPINIKRESLTDEQQPLKPAVGETRSAVRDVGACFGAVLLLFCLGGFQFAVGGQNAKSDGTPNSRSHSATEQNQFAALPHGCASSQCMVPRNGPLRQRGSNQDVTSQLPVPSLALRGITPLAALLRAGPRKPISGSAVWRLKNKAMEDSDGYADTGEPTPVVVARN